MAADNHEVNTPELSIIIISYNTEKITQNCLDSIITSLKNDNLAYEIIVVDNASTDDSVKMISDYSQKNPNIRLLKNKENIGFARANNQAVKTAKGDYLLFLNSDIIVLDHAIMNLFEYFKNHEPSFHFLGAKLFNKDKSPQPSCGPFYSLPVVFTALFLKGDYWGATRYSPDKPKKVDWVSGACILTKKEYFERVGGFDEKIFMYMEEIDLFYRTKKYGYKVYFYPDAGFIHLGSSSSAGKTYPIIQVYKGFLYLYKKHFPGPKLFFLKNMLKLKALLGLFIGKALKNHYLEETYAQAYKIVNVVR